MAPLGVFAVETKTRRKRKTPPGVKDDEVIFDGSYLQFPHGQDKEAVEQARRQANQLRVMLKKAVGQEVGVTPILTVPGWYVVARAKSDVRVVNPKGIRGVVLNGGRSELLSLEMMERITYQLDQKCRDVEL